VFRALIYVNQSNRIALEGGKIIQLDRADFGHVSGSRSETPTSPRA
jgi:hypothetical protein